MRYNMKTKLLACIFYLISLSSCYAARVDGPYEGRVVDADTGQPIEKVVVLGVWYTEQTTPAGATSHYYDATETVTDKNGEFKISGKGLRVISSLEPITILIFKARYEHLGNMLWDSLKEDILLKEKIKWEGNKAIIPLKKLTMVERKKELGPPSPPHEAPKEKIKLMLKEINEDRREQGLGPIEVGR